jgi:hypothetical protein
MACGRAEAQPANVVRVEEDWELVVLDPDVASNGPQVTCVISPSGGVDSYYVSLEINFRSLPSYTPGGLQYQMWNGEQHLLTRSFPESRVMNTADETIRWTQTMSLSNGETGLDDLSLYSPDVSVEHSGVGYAANRVWKLELTRVRYVLANGDVVEDNAPRPVFQHD